MQISISNAKRTNVLQPVSRVEWVDIYKALAIVLMVVGHATGRFNGYIYQFHIAAFFFISGFVSSLEKKSFSEIFVSRFLTLIVPLLFFIFFSAFIIQFLPEHTRASLFSLPYLGVSKTLLTFFSRGSVYIQFLGATWFLSVLFGINLMSKFLLDITPNKYVYFLLSIVFYFAGYHLCKEQISPKLSFVSIDLVFVGQLFFVTGFCAKRIIKTVEQKVLDRNVFFVLEVAMFIINIMLLFLFRKIGGVVDYANRRVNNIFYETSAAFNGIVFLILCSKIIEKIPLKIRKILLWVGKNTIGIVFFHFATFKIMLVVFYMLGRVNFSDVSNVVPPSYQGNWFAVYTFVGVFCSLAFWEICKKLPFLRCFCVGEISSQIVQKICASAVVKNCETIYDKITSTIKDVAEFCLAKSMFKPFVVGALVFAVLFCVRFIPNKALKQNNVASGQIAITFPYEKNNVNFATGWLPQTQEEKYRWVAKESVFFVGLAGQRSFYFEGYVPEGFNQLTKMEVYVNDKLTRTVALKAGTGFSAKIDIGQFVNYGSQNQFKFIFDWERIPQKTDSDKRIFSALLSKMILR